MHAWLYVPTHVHYIQTTHDYALTWLCMCINYCRKESGHARTQLGVAKYFPKAFTQTAFASPFNLKPLLHCTVDK